MKSPIAEILYTLEFSDSFETDVFMKKPEGMSWFLFLDTIKSLREGKPITEAQINLVMDVLMMGNTPECQKLAKQVNELYTDVYPITSFV